MEKSSFLWLISLNTSSEILYATIPAGHKFAGLARFGLLSIELVQITSHPVFRVNLIRY